MVESRSDGRLPNPPGDRAGVEVWVGDHLSGLYSGLPAGSPRFTGGQTEADRALAQFDVAGYATRRNEVLPVGRRGASGLSPYLRHGLLTLPRVWEAVAGGPSRDVAKFRDELLWQEYARHLYARLGRAVATPLRFQRQVEGGDREVWMADMACTGAAIEELEIDGWLVNQARMWLASHWSVRHEADWRRGEDWFFRHLLDGSRAANRLGWQWTVGSATGKAYGFSRWQVEKRAPGLCADCPLRNACPIEDWPDSTDLVPTDLDPRLRSDPNPGATAGPTQAMEVAAPDAVWLTAESLGDDDPALAAHPDLPAVFVFDEPLLTRLQLSAKRLIFLAESLADLAERRMVEVHRGDPVAVLRDRKPAVTFAPVPGWRSRAQRIATAVIYPWPWLRQPHDGPVSSFSAWRKRLPA